MPVRTISVRNASFQQWETLLHNRTKRNRAGQMIVHGVRPIRLALDAQVPIHAVLVNSDGTRSRWALDTLSLVRDRGAEQFHVSSELLRELAEEKDDDAPEVLLIVTIPPDDPGRIPAASDLLAVALDRPSSPGEMWDRSCARSMHSAATASTASPVTLSTRTTPARCEPRPVRSSPCPRLGPRATPRRSRMGGVGACCGSRDPGGGHG